MQKEMFPFFYELRTRYAEVDSQGVVFNAHYLTYFDTVLTEYMRHIGYDYLGLVNARGLDFHLVKATVEYLAPIRFDESIQIGVVAGRIGNSSLTWIFGIFGPDESEPRAKGEIVWVCSKVGTHKAHPLPEDLTHLLKTQEILRESTGTPQ